MKCIVCHSEKVRINSRMSREGFKISVVECSSCGHFSQPRENYEEIYTTGEFTQQARQQVKTPSAAKIKELDKRALKRMHYYKKFLEKPQQVLEVGSSIGSFVHTLRLAGKDAHGIEPDPDYAHYSKGQYGFDQADGLLEDYTTDKKFDLICSFHVLEHVEDPHTFVAKSQALLNDGGTLLFEFPSLELHMYGSMKQTMWKPHIHYFTRASVYQLFSQYFEVLEIGYYGSALFVHARKSANPTFKRSELLKQKRKASRVRFFVKIFPGIPIKTTGISAKQLLMQSLFFQKNTRDLIKRFFKFGIFALKNRKYLKAETGSGTIRATHFSYYSGWENAGDTILSKCVRDNFNLIEPTRWTLKKVTSPVSSATIEEINKQDYLVVGGGGLLLPDSNPNVVSGWQWAISQELLAQINVPFIVYAIGYNFFRGQEPDERFKQSLHQLIDKSSFFSLRNKGSIDAVSEIVGPELAEKIKFQPCPTTVIRKVDPSIGPKKKTKNIGVNIAYDRYHLRYGKDIYVILDQIAMALKQISEKGYKIYNICHLENDQKFELTLDKHGISYEHINLQYELPDVSYQVYNEMELVMGTRGHAQMIPFGVNTKIISLGSHNKLRWFLEDIDASDWFIELNQEVATICDRLTTLFFDMIDSEKIEERIAIQQSKLYEITTANHKKIGDLILPSH